MYRLPRRLLVAGLVVVAGPVGLGACGNDPTTGTFDPTNTTVPTTPTFQEPVGFVRMLNLVLSEEDGANIYVDGHDGPVQEGVEPLEGSSWRQLDPGLRTFRVGPAGSEDEADDWAEVELDILDDSRHSIVIHGTGDDIRLLAFEEDPGSVAKDDVRYSFFHADPAQGPMDLWDLGDDEATTPVVDDLTYGVDPTFLRRRAGAFDLGVDLDDDGTADVAFEIPDLGGRITVPLYFLVDGDELLFVGQTPQADVRVLREPLTAP